MILGLIYRNIYLSKDQGEGRLGIIANPLKNLAEIPLVFKALISTPEFFVKNNSAKDGLVQTGEFNTIINQKLLTSYKEGVYASVVSLIDLKSGKHIKNWRPDNKNLFKKAFNSENPIAPPNEDSDLYFMHPLMLADSSIIVNSQISSLLTRFDKNGEIVWLNNDRIYHHSIEQDTDGNVFTCSRPFKSKSYNFLPEDFDSDIFFYDDHITKINPKSGEILYDKPIIDILIENGYLDLLLAKGQIMNDPIHLNDIQPALESSEFWLKGDLLLSFRNLSTIALYRPATEKIIWLKSGPWFNQHDVDFVEDSKILVFGNDVIREETVEGGVDSRLTTQDLYFSKSRPYNNAYIYDLRTGEITTPFYALFKNEGIRTYTSGRCDFLSNGLMMIEDTENGRIIIGDSLSKKMEFTHRIDNEHISYLFWSRIIN